METYCDKILAVSPKNDWAMALSGWQCYFRAPSVASAQTALQRIDTAIAWNPASPDHQLKAGRIYWHMVPAAPPFSAPFVRPDVGW